MNEPFLMLDLDNTIIDTSQIYLKGIPDVVKKYIGISLTEEDVYLHWGKPAKKILAGYCELLEETTDALVERMYADFTEFFNKKHNDLSFPYSGVMRYFPLIREKSEFVVVVSTRSSDRSAPVMEMEFAKFIDAFVWGDYVEKPKPYPDGLDYAINKYRKGSSDCFYLGDNAHDITAAKRTRVKTKGLAALWGAVDKDKLLSADPDEAFESFQEFSEWFISRVV